MKKRRSATSDTTRSARDGGSGSSSSGGAHKFSRQIATYGRDEQQRIARASVLISGLDGLGAEVAKNLVLSGIAECFIHDDRPLSGSGNTHESWANFYISEMAVDSAHQQQQQQQQQEQQSQQGHAGQKSSSGGSSCGVTFSRADATVEALRRQNPMVDVQVLRGSLLAARGGEDGRGASAVPGAPKPVNLVRHFDLVILVGHSHASIEEVNAACRADGVPLIAAGVEGLVAWVFNDFGPHFTTHNADGQPPLEFLVEGVSRDNPALLTTIKANPDDVSAEPDRIRHRLQSGARVKFKGNDNTLQQVYTVTVRDPFSFFIDANGAEAVFDPFRRVATVQEVKVAQHLEFRTFDDASKSSASVLVMADMVKSFGASSVRHELLLHFMIRALHTLQAHQIKPMNAGPQFSRWPNDPQREPSLYHRFKLEVLELVRQYNDANGTTFEMGPHEDDLVARFWRSAGGMFTPLHAVMGGIVAQEGLKGIMQKYTPLSQFLYIDVLELAPSASASENLDAPVSVPQSAAIAVRRARARSIGSDVAQALDSLSVFVVGSGAIGCELIKNLAQLGVSSSQNAKSYVTDPDTVEASNLCRQFLFSSQDVDCVKSEAAVKAIKSIRPNFQVQNLAEKVCPETETQFTHAFWAQFGCVLNALDNVQARSYTDARCIAARVPLIDSGTTGTQAHVQVMIPHHTETWGALRDADVQESIPECVIHSFPTSINHTIGWAKELLRNHFCDGESGPSQIVKASRHIAAHRSTVASLQIELPVLQKIDYFMQHRPARWQDCVDLALKAFHEHFVSNIRELLDAHPLNETIVYKDESGVEHEKPFWSPPRRPPTAPTFSLNNETHVAFVHAFTRLSAEMFGVDTKLSGGVADKGNFCEVLRTRVPKIESVWKQEKAHAKEEVDATELVRKIVGARGGRSSALYSLRNLRTTFFEKDDDNNGHIALVNAASNIRACSYGIEPLSFEETKVIAGKIIPAIATTTSAVAGLVIIEMVKVVKFRLHHGSECFAHPPVSGISLDGRIAIFRDANLNLALSEGAVNLMDPQTPQRLSIPGCDEVVTRWSRWEFDAWREMTVQDLIDFVSRRVSGVKIQSVVELKTGTTVFRRDANRSGNITHESEQYHELLPKLLEASRSDFVDLQVTTLPNSTANEPMPLPTVRLYIKPRKSALVIWIRRAQSPNLQHKRTIAAGPEPAFIDISAGIRLLLSLAGVESVVKHIADFDELFLRHSPLPMTLLSRAGCLPCSFNIAVQDVSSGSWYFGLANILEGLEQRFRVYLHPEHNLRPAAPFLQSGRTLAFFMETWIPRSAQLLAQNYGASVASSARTVAENDLAFAAVQDDISQVVQSFKTLFACGSRISYPDFALVPLLPLFVERAVVEAQATRRRVEHGKASRLPVEQTSAFFRRMLETMCADIAPVICHEKKFSVAILLPRSKCTPGVRGTESGVEVEDASDGAGWCQVTVRSFPVDVTVDAVIRVVENIVLASRQETGDFEADMLAAYRLRFCPTQSCSRSMRSTRDITVRLGGSKTGSSKANRNWHYSEAGGRLSMQCILPNGHFVRSVPFKGSESLLKATGVFGLDRVFVDFTCDARLNSGTSTLKLADLARRASACRGDGSEATTGSALGAFLPCAACGEEGKCLDDRHVRLECAFIPPPLRQRSYSEEMQELIDLGELQKVRAVDMSAVQHSFWKEAVASQPRNMSRIEEELRSLQTALPLSDEGGSIFVAYDRERPWVMKALVIGPVDTPYQNGCFEFDVLLPSNYPASAPKMKLVTTGNGSVRFNANLYANGKVCLSLLGTWRGPGWDPKRSTLLQVLQSIPWNIMIGEPVAGMCWFNEPGYDSGRTGHKTKLGKLYSEAYDKQIRRCTMMYAMEKIIRAPPSTFISAIHSHFSTKSEAVAKQLIAWAEQEGVTPGSATSASSSKPTVEYRIADRVRQCHNTFELAVLLQFAKHIAPDSVRDKCTKLIEARKLQIETLETIRRRYQAIYLEYALVLLDNMLTAAHPQQQLWNEDFPTLESQRFQYMTSQAATAEWCSPGTFVATASEQKRLPMPMDKCIAQFVATTKTDHWTAGWILERHLLQASKNVVNAAIDEFFNHPRSPSKRDIVYSLPGSTGLVTASGHAAGVASGPKGANLTSADIHGLGPITESHREQGRLLMTMLANMGLNQWDETVWTAVCHCNAPESANELAPLFIEKVLGGQFVPEMYLDRSSKAAAAAEAVVSQVSVFADEESESTSSEKVAHFVLGVTKWKCICASFLGLPESLAVHELSKPQCDMCGVSKSQGNSFQQPLDPGARTLKAGVVLHRAKACRMFLELCDQALSKKPEFEKHPAAVRWIYRRKVSKSLITMTPSNAFHLEIAFQNLTARMLNSSVDNSFETPKLEYLVLVQSELVPQASKSKKQVRIPPFLVDVRTMRAVSLKPSFRCARCNKATTPAPLASFSPSSHTIGEQVLFQTLRATIVALSTNSTECTLAVACSEFQGKQDASKCLQPVKLQDGSDGVMLTKVPTCAVFSLQSKADIEKGLAAFWHCGKCGSAAPPEIWDLQRVDTRDHLSKVADLVKTNAHLKPVASIVARLKAFEAELEHNCQTATASVAALTAQSVDLTLDDVSEVAADAVGWTCTVCTFIVKDASATVCACCGSPKNTVADAASVPAAPQVAPAKPSHTQPSFSCRVCRAWNESKVSKEPPPVLLCNTCSLPQCAFTDLLRVGCDSIGVHEILAQNQASGSANNASLYNDGGGGNFGAHSNHVNDSTPTAIQRRVSAQGPYIPKTTTTASIVANLNRTLEELCDGTLVYNPFGKRTAAKLPGTVLGATSANIDVWGTTDSLDPTSPSYSALSPTYDLPSPVYVPYGRGRGRGRGAHGGRGQGRGRGGGRGTAGGRGLGNGSALSSLFDASGEADCVCGDTEGDDVCGMCEDVIDSEFTCPGCGGGLCEGCGTSLGLEPPEYDYDYGFDDY